MTVSVTEACPRGRSQIAAFCGGAVAAGAATRPRLHAADRTGDRLRSPLPLDGFDVPQAAEGSVQLPADLPAVEF